jgi:hypothetical protein
MWIVRLALRRPYTFVVVSLLALLLGIGGDRMESASVTRLAASLCPKFLIPPFSESNLTHVTGVGPAPSVSVRHFIGAGLHGCVPSQLSLCYPLILPPGFGRPDRNLCR